MEKRFIDSVKIKNGKATQFTLTIIGYEDDGTHVAYSPALDMYAYGSTKQEALQAMDETIHLYVDHVHEEGTLAKDLMSHGWKESQLLEKKFTPPKYDPRVIMSNLGVNSFQVQDRRLALQH